MDESQNNMTTPAMEPQKNGSTGTVVAAVVILAILVVGALYFWKERSYQAPDTDQSVESITTQGTSDDTASIEADLESTDVDNLDAELNAAS
jgi:uncharacterized protein HemX